MIVVFGDLKKPEPLLNCKVVHSKMTGGAAECKDLALSDITNVMNFKTGEKGKLETEDSGELKNVLKKSTTARSSLHRSMFKKFNSDMSAMRVSKKDQTAKLRNKFASPTDRLLSPCSQKLNEHKSRLFKAKSNPTKLSFDKTEHPLAGSSNGNYDYSEDCDITL